MGLRKAVSASTFFFVFWMLSSVSYQKVDFTQHKKVYYNTEARYPNHFFAVEK
jgi:hypothetical protein